MDYDIMEVAEHHLVAAEATGRILLNLDTCQANWTRRNIENSQGSWKVMETLLNCLR